VSKQQNLAFYPVLSSPFSIFRQQANLRLSDCQVVVAEQVGKILLEDCFSWTEEHTWEFNLTSSPLSGPNSVTVSFDGTTFTISAPRRQCVQYRYSQRKQFFDGLRKKIMIKEKQ